MRSWRDSRRRAAKTFPEPTEELGKAFALLGQAVGPCERLGGYFEQRRTHVTGPGSKQGPHAIAPIDAAKLLVIGEFAEAIDMRKARAKGHLGDGSLGWIAAHGTKALVLDSVLVE